MAEYHMNKKESEITERQELLEVLRRGKYAVLALCRDNEPYIVTMNYGYDRERNALYFHTSEKGLKINFIRHNPRVCGTVVEDRGYQAGQCDHAYRSVVFWGKLRILEDMAEKKHGMDILLHHLEDEPDQVKEKLLRDDAVYQKRKLAILELTLDIITGKEGQ